MTLNHVPKLSKDNPTGCCPRFSPKDWDGQTFQFKNKSFVRFTVKSFFYMPLNMDSMMRKTLKTLDDSRAMAGDEHLMLSYDLSPWRSEHFIAVTKAVAGMENVQLSGTFMSKVFEGPFQDTPKWMQFMQDYIKSKGKTAKKIYLYYTMCPSCSKHYGKNYVVALAKV